MILFLLCASPYSAVVKGPMLLYADVQSTATRKGIDASTFDLHIKNVPFKYSLFFCRRYVTQNVLIRNIQTLLKIHCFYFLGVPDEI
jgi:hypothetical protein